MWNISTNKQANIHNWCNFLLTDIGPVLWLIISAEIFTKAASRDCQWLHLKGKNKCEIDRDGKIN